MKQPLSCVSSLVAMSPHGFHTKAACSALPKPGLSWRVGISA